jgi:hypothetical protein
MPRLRKKKGNPRIKKNTPTPVSTTVIVPTGLDPTRMPAWKISHKPKSADRGARRRRTVPISNLLGIIFQHFLEIV